VHLFLWYASANRPRAGEIAWALKADGHDVFFDGAKLAGGENYHHVIREQIAETDLVFLISYGQHFLSDRGSSACSGAGGLVFTHPADCESLDQSSQEVERKTKR
jgi:hypothetical protein